MSDETFEHLKAEKDRIEAQDRARLLAPLEAELADWKGRAQRQYDENVALIAKVAALEAELQKVREKLAKVEQERDNLLDAADGGRYGRME